MTLHTQTYLRNGGTLDELQTKLAITAKPHTKYGNIYLLKYDQIDSDFSNPIVKECRGLILDRDNEWAVVNCGLYKFHNFGEILAANIDFGTARVYEKLDGSLAQLFSYGGQWNMATSGSCAGEGMCGDFGFSFSTLFWKHFKYKLPPLDCGVCFFFELCSMYNKIVVRQAEPTITLLGARNLNTLQELTLEQAHEYFPDVPIVQSYPLTSFEECVAVLKDTSPLEHEGFVVCDAQFNRVKIKSDQYVALHHLKSSLGSSMRALVSVVLNNEVDEVANQFSEYKNLLYSARDKLNALVKELECAYKEIAAMDIKDQKSFALEVQRRKLPCASALYSLRAGKTTSIRKHISEMHLDRVMDLLGYKSSNEK